MQRNAFSLLLCVSLVFAIGLLMVFNTTAAEGLHRANEQSAHLALIKQILYALLSMGGAYVIYKIGYLQIIRWAPFFLASGTLLLLLVFLPGVGQQINGAHRWIYLFGNSFQPSELMKFVLPIYYIHYLSCHAPLTARSFLKLIALLSAPIALILAEPDNGTVAILLTLLVVLCVLSRLRWLYWALPLIILALGGIIAASQMPHAQDRLNVYLHPELDLQGKGHQPYQAKIAAGSGQLWGRGLAESLQKLDYLPEARSDYIAAIYAEEFGFIGIFLLIVLYMLISYFGFRIAQESQTREGFYLAAITTFLIAFQVFLNLGVTSGLLPSKGTNLPFFSHGGSSLLANVLGIGLIVSVADSQSAGSKIQLSVKRK